MVITVEKIGRGEDKPGRNAKAFHVNGDHTEPPRLPRRPGGRPQGVLDESSLRGSPSPPMTKSQRELPCLLATVVFVEGKPQQSHRRLIALGSRLLVLRSSVVNSVGE